jgi:hypothetical protein
MHYIPYNNIRIQWRAGHEGFQLLLPWVSLDIDVLPSEKGWIELAINSLHSNPYHPFVQKFLEQLKDYTVAYIAARKKSELSELQADSVKKYANLQQFADPHALVQSLDQEAYQSIRTILPQQWTWSIDEVLRISQIEESNLYDSLTVVSYLIGKRLTNESLTAGLRLDLPKELDRLRIRDEERFFEVMKMLIRQTHYITTVFDNYARPSLEVFKKAQSLILQYLQAEKNHDHLMKAALIELGCDNPNLIKPFEVTVLVMNLFKWAASNSPLAFTLMIGFFEGSNYQDTDPLADVLMASSKPKAGRGYAIHYEINKNEQHNKVITNLANYLEPRVKEEVIYATRILELATLLGALGDKHLIQLTKGV